MFVLVITVVIKFCSRTTVLVDTLMLVRTSVPVTSSVEVITAASDMPLGVGDTASEVASAMVATGVGSEAGVAVGSGAPPHAPSKSVKAISADAITAGGFGWFDMIDLLILS